MSEPTKFLLGEEQIPTHWVNLLPDLPGEPLPPLSPAHRAARRTRRPDADLPDGADRAGGLAPSPRSRSPTRCARPTGCGGRRRCSARAGWRRRSARSAHIYYKYEGVSPAGSHKPNTAVPQAYENAKAGIKKLATETGAGQWGSSLAFACSLFGLECEVFMVGSSYDQKPYRRSMMETWGATVHRSPSDRTAVRPRAGRAPDRLARDRDLRGGRGRRAGPGLQLLARLRAQPRAAAPDRDRAGGDPADGAGGRGAGRDRRLRRRRLELRRARVPVPARRQPTRASSPPSRPRARRSPAAPTATTSATPRG